MSKPVNSLTPEDFAMFPVWEYDLDAEGTEGQDETWVRPVEEYPVIDLDNRVIGTTISLHNGAPMLACLSNVALNNAQATAEFLTLSLWFQGEWLGLAGLLLRAEWMDGDEWWWAVTDKETGTEVNSSNRQNVQCVSGLHARSAAESAARTCLTLRDW
jgi:hypothetical protein